MKPRKPIRRSAPKRVNTDRAATSFARSFHSRERVEFVQSLPCIVCGRRPCDNAHIGTKGAGAGRRADYDQVAPLCRRLSDDGVTLAGCHALSHQHGLAYVLGAGWAQKVARAIADTERRWLAFSLAPETTE